MQYQTQITDYGYQGEGVGRVNGKVCFVPYTMIGETVSFDVKKETKAFIKGKLLHVETASADRKDPPCPYFGICGGCQFQHMDYSQEIKIKKSLLKKQLFKLGYTDEFETIESPSVYGYRNKIKLFCGNDGLALMEESTNDLVPISKCLLIDNEMNKVLTKLQNFVLKMKISTQIENVVIRKEADFVLVWFIFKRALKVDFSWLSFILGKNCSIFSSIRGEKPIYQSGLKDIVVQEFGLDCTFAADAFHQVNPEVCHRLYNQVLTYAIGEKIVNAYSGGGVLSALLARTHDQVIGIELGFAEHRAAEKLKQDNHLENMQNIQGDCAIEIPKLSFAPDCVILDPPRGGCDSKVIETLNTSLAKTIIYISCNSATLIRDVAGLTQYSIKKVILYDMFPRTSNYEILMILERK